MNMQETQAIVGQDIKNILNVNEQDMRRVYRKYIKNKNAIYLSVVPKAQSELILSGIYFISIHQRRAGCAKAEKEFQMNTVKKTPTLKKPSSFDRSLNLR